MAILDIIDLARQARQGSLFALPKEAGGTGRDDGLAHGLILTVSGRAAVSQFSVVKAVFDHGDTAPGMMVEPLDATTDIPIGVALRTPSVDYGDIPVMLAGITQALVTGPIAVGDKLYPAASGRLSSTAGTGGSVGRALEVVSGVTDATIWIYVEPNSGSGGVAVLTANQKTFGLDYVIDGGGNVITTGGWGDVRIPVGCTITGAEIRSRVTGSIVVDVQRATSYDTFSSICGGTKPTLSAAQRSVTTISGWTTSLSQGDFLSFVVDSASTAQRVTVSLQMEKT